MLTEIDVGKLLQKCKGRIRFGNWICDFIWWQMWTLGNLSILHPAKLPVTTKARSVLQLAQHL
jgi:hypothetical protein